MSISRLTLKVEYLWPELGSRQETARNRLLYHANTENVRRHNGNKEKNVISCYKNNTETKETVRE